MSDTTRRQFLGVARADTPLHRGGDRRIDGHDVSDLLFGDADAQSPTDLFLYYTSNGDLAGVRRRQWKLMIEKGELYDLEQDISEKWNLAEKHPALVEELTQLARSRDAEITEHARPVLRVESPLWEPASPP